MRTKPAKDLMKEMKKRYDKNPKEWRVLTGLDSKNRYDTFISSGDKRLWQMKAEQVGQNEIVGVGMKVAKMDEEIEKIMKAGATVPFGIISPQSKDLAIIMAGIQQYSSSSTNQLNREHVSSKQAKLQSDLEKEIESMINRDPLMSKKYKAYKDLLNKSYI